MLDEKSLEYMLCLLIFFHTLKSVKNYSSQELSLSLLWWWETTLQHSQCCIAQWWWNPSWGI